MTTLVRTAPERMGWNVNGANSAWSIDEAAIQHNISTTLARMNLVSSLRSDLILDSRCSAAGKTQKLPIQ